MEVLEIELEKIKPLGTVNTREDIGDLSDIMPSIIFRLSEGNMGLIYPILIRRVENSTYEYEIVDGKRRYFSYQQLGLEKIPAEVITGTLEELALTAYIGTKGHKEFTWFEEGKFYYLMNKGEWGSPKGKGMKLEEIGKIVGKTKQSVSDYKRTYEVLEKYARTYKLEYSVAKVIAQQFRRADKELAYGEFFPEEERQEMINYVLENKLNKRKTFDMVYNYINLKILLESLENFHPETAKELKGVYYPHRFNPKVFKLFEKEKNLVTGIAKLQSIFLDKSKYPTKESAEEYAKHYYGELIGPITIEGWEVRIIPYTKDEIREELKTIVEKR